MGLEVHAALANTGGFSAEELASDQVRFDMVFNIIAPEIEVIALIREASEPRGGDRLPAPSRLHGRLQEDGVLDQQGAVGHLDRRQGDPAFSEQTLPEEAYPSQIEAEGEERLTIAFDRGEIAAVNGKPYTDKVEAIRAVEAIGSRYGIGRDMHIGDTIIGIKGRVGFEAAAPMLIIAAHKMLEKHTLTKNLRQPE